MAERADADGVRRRAVATTTSAADAGDGDEGDEGEGAALIFNMEKSNSLAAYELATRPGAYAGYLHKRAARCCKGLFDCCPIYNRRYFVLYGDFLYRYGNHKSKRPKGIPLMVSSATVAVMDEVDKKPGFFLEVGDYRKELVLRCKSVGERKAWVDRLRAARMRIVREQKGHATVDSFTRAANRAGAAMYDERIKRERREMEVQMKDMNATLGVPAPLGQ